MTTTNEFALGLTNRVWLVIANDEDLAFDLREAIDGAEKAGEPVAEFIKDIVQEAFDEVSVLGPGAGWEQLFAASSYAVLELTDWADIVRRLRQLGEPGLDDEAAYDYRNEQEEGRGS